MYVSREHSHVCMSLACMLNEYSQVSMSVLVERTHMYSHTYVSQALTCMYEFHVYASSVLTGKHECTSRENECTSRENSHVPSHVCIASTHMYASLPQSRELTCSLTCMHHWNSLASVVLASIQICPVTNVRIRHVHTYTNESCHSYE